MLARIKVGETGYTLIKTAEGDQWYPDSQIINI